MSPGRGDGSLNVNAAIAATSRVSMKTRPTPSARQPNLVALRNVNAIGGLQVLCEKRGPQECPRHFRGLQVLFDLPMRHDPVDAHDGQEHHLLDATALGGGDERSKVPFGVRYCGWPHQKHPADTGQRGGEGLRLLEVQQSALRRAGERRRVTRAGHHRQTCGDKYSRQRFTDGAGRPSHQDGTRVGRHRFILLPTDSPVQGRGPLPRVPWLWPGRLRSAEIVVSSPTGPMTVLLGQETEARDLGPVITGPWPQRTGAIRALAGKAKRRGSDQSRSKKFHRNSARPLGRNSAFVSHRSTS